MRKIRKISIGSDPKNCLAYSVDTKIVSQGLTITDITEEQSNKIRKSNPIYYVWAKTDGGEPFIWYKAENMPVVIQYDIPA